MRPDDRARNRPALDDDPTSIDESPLDRRRRLTLPRATSPLSDRLHGDHLRARELLVRVSRLPVGDARDVAWNEAFVCLTAHTHAEEDIVYGRLLADERLRYRVDAACAAHGRIEDLLLGADAVRHDEPAFRRRVEELTLALAEHVADEEDELLPLAERLLEPSDLEGMLVRFRTRRAQVERELRSLRSRT